MVNDLVDDILYNQTAL